jgi:zinc-finger of a C2HC-type
MRVAGTELAKYAASSSKGSSSRTRASTASRPQRSQQQQQQQQRLVDHENTAIGTKSGNSKWRQQSSAFREAIRNARMVTQAQAKGIPLRDLPLPKKVSQPDPSLVPCPHCNRTFSEQAAERHIPKCMSIKAQPGRLQKGSGRGLGISSRTSTLASSRPTARNSAGTGTSSSGYGATGYSADSAVASSSKKRLSSTVGAASSSGSRR